MITGINESKTLTKHISCENKCRLDGRKGNSDQWWNNDKCQCECKKLHACEKDYVWNLVICNCKNGKFLVSVMDDSVIICDEAESYDEEPEAKSYDKTDFNESKTTGKMQNCYILRMCIFIWWWLSGRGEILADFLCHNNITKITKQCKIMTKQCWIDHFAYVLSLRFKSDIY